MKTMGDRLRFRRKQLGISQAEVARRVAGIRKTSFSQQAYAQLEKGDSRRSSELPAICEVLGVSLKWIRDNEGSPPLPPGAPVAKSLVTSFDPDALEQETPPRDTRAAGAIPEFDLRGGASYGGGYVVRRIDGDEAVKAEWFFPESWLRGEMRLSRQSTDIIAVDGPSMLPDLAPGDRVLIDRSNRDPKQDAIFAIRDGDSVIIKHVQLIRDTEPPRIICTSSNPTYKPFELILDGEDVAIIGRVAGRISKM
ncbi:XRE family transcriptional regulator [Methylocystis iwaonis]|uniref:HTH cro/C1-type domain-containing protein n=1 Tax=Methylocystis iwaonis TaxID=2885079 RepID=A0ABM8E7X1_9HYPH|nr:S24 family peptidase [Methylocystis iwaonis]BDV33946.1 hypothetical protein SS37A_14750 [Methylocystis iwaonis]